MYLPKDCNGSNPVVAFVTGGAWIIGSVNLFLTIINPNQGMKKAVLIDLVFKTFFSYKAWGSLLGKRLAERGVIVACIDYR